jgi:hypothetical protein
MVVDDSGSTAFSVAFGCHTNFSNTAGGFNYIAGTGIANQSLLQSGKVIVIYQLPDPAGEDRCLNKNHR